MRKSFITVLIAVLMNFLIMPVTNAEVLTLESSTVKNSDVTFCGYALFAKRKEVLRAKIKKNPKDAMTWYELGRIHYGLEEYGDALTAFKKALDIEPNNKEFKKAYDATIAKLAEKNKNNKPNFSGLG